MRRLKVFGLGLIVGRDSELPSVGPPAAPCPRTIKKMLGRQWVVGYACSLAEGHEEPCDYRAVRPEQSA